MSRRISPLTIPIYLLAAGLLLLSCGQLPLGNGEAPPAGRQTSGPNNSANSQAALPTEAAPITTDAELTTAATASQVESSAESAALAPTQSLVANVPYTVVDTGEERCYNDTQEAPCPQSGEAFFGQDAQYQGVQFAFQDNGDGTVTDLNTGLMWQQTPDLNRKSTYAEAVANAAAFNLAGYTDWRLPTLKELYSLINFSGSSVSQTPYINTDFFDFRYGDEGAGERLIDAQYWSSTEYVGTTMNGDATVFGVNFADGRIKGYPRDTGAGGSPFTAFVRYVRGNPDYGVNNFVDNGDGVIADRATGLMWQQSDSGAAMDWESALGYCENLDYAGQDDWRLPDAKELQSIVDYTRAPDAADPAARSAALNPIFELTEVESWFWTGTTLLEAPPSSAAGSQAIYLTFGQAFGYMSGPGGGDATRMNVHGAGAQRSDPKSGDPVDWAGGFGPQGDEVRIFNYVRCVRSGSDFVEAANSGAGEPVSQQSSSAQSPGVAPEQPSAGGALEVAWASNVVVAYTDTYIIVESNGIPTHESGPFPMMADTNNDGRPDNPNEVQAQEYRFLIPLNPQIAGTTTELPMGPIGVALSGIPFYNAWSAEDTYAVETEVFDSCQGHPDQNGRYHYHQLSSCLSASVLGYAFDGFEIRGFTEANGETAAGLDECNGHEHDGSYHYHVTADPSRPVMGCYRGVVETSNFDNRAAAGAGAPQQQGDGQGQYPQTGTPPQEALDACNRLSENAVCEFTAPQGALISGVCRLAQTQLACAPQEGP